jgi:hypothetical protein
MPRFNPETAMLAMEVHQLILDWGDELDVNGGLTVARLLTEDCTYLVGGNTMRGHAAVLKFYTDRGERVRKLQKDGIRTQRHTITNLRSTFANRDQAEVRFMIVNYSAEGKPPAMNLVGPSIIADCKMQCRRDTDGEWRICLFDSTPVFVGNDPFLNATVVQK